MTYLHIKEEQYMVRLSNVDIVANRIVRHAIDPGPILHRDGLCYRGHIIKCGHNRMRGIEVCIHLSLCLQARYQLIICICS